jgi:hypothetical protein
MWAAVFVARNDRRSNDHPMVEEKQKLHFYVDAKRYKTEKSSLTGAEIKTIARVTPT